jgi:translation initiation factor 3 subunit A
LATLSIPHGADTSTILTKLLDIEDQHATNIRVLSSLLRLPVAPTRAGLLKELTLLNIPELAVEPVRKIYNLLELEFSPLRLASKINVELEDLERLGRDDYSQYVEELKNIVATRVLRQVN